MCPSKLNLSVSHFDGSVPGVAGSLCGNGLNLTFVCVGSCDDAQRQAEQGFLSARHLAAAGAFCPGSDGVAS
jgi:hypothetical protein